MVIDDDDDLRETVRDVFEQAGYQVALAADGADALAQLRGGLRPGLILLDLSMPRMSGLEFREAQQRDAAIAEIPTIVLSASENLTETARRLDPTGVLRKPVSLRELLRLAERWCGAP